MRGLGLVSLATLVLTALVLVAQGWAPGRSVLMGLAIAVPVTLLQAWIMSRRLMRSLGEAAPHTHGVTMSWAAPFYDAYCPLLGLGQHFRRETLRHADIKAGEHVLDVGCGTGVLTRLAAAAVGSSGSVTGIDPSPGMIAMARRNALGARVEFRLGAIEALPFPDASFDLVLSSFMVHHLPPQVKRAGFAEVWRVLKPGGRLLVVDIDRPANPLWWLVCWPLLFMHFTAPNLRGEVPAYLRAAGFSPVQVRARKAGLLTFWWAARPAVE